MQCAALTVTSSDCRCHTGVCTYDATSITGMRDDFVRQIQKPSGNTISCIGKPNTIVDVSRPARDSLGKKISQTGTTRHVLSPKWNFRSLPSYQCIRFSCVKGLRTTSQRTHTKDHSVVWFLLEVLHQFLTQPKQMPKSNAMVTFEFWTFFCSSRFRRPGSVHRFGKWTNWAVSRQPEASAHTSWPCFIHSDYLLPVNISLCQNRQSISFGFVFHRILMWVRDFPLWLSQNQKQGTNYFESYFGCSSLCHSPTHPIAISLFLR